MDMTAPTTIMIRQRCLHCDGLGYVEIRDCAGEVQREETCLFCRGTGELIPESAVEPSEDDS